MRFLETDRHESTAAADRVPHVVVVDPRFEQYRALAASERQGKITLHMRSSGLAALRLADAQDVDAWLIASELDDMSGHDFVELLRSRFVDSKVSVVLDAGSSDRHAVIAETESREVGADSVLAHPITLRDLESLLEMPAEERSRLLASDAPSGKFVSLQLGVSVAAAAIAVLMMS